MVEKMNILVISDIHNDVENIMAYSDKMVLLDFDVLIAIGDFTDYNVPKGFNKLDIGKLIIEELKTFKKPICEMLATQGAVYVATSSIGYPKDIQAKVKKALGIKGPKFLLIHAPCPIAWRFQPQQTVKLAQLAVESGIWVLYEIENGILKINKEPKGIPVEGYLKLQGRFKHLTEKEIKVIQEHVNKDWQKYKELQSAGVRI